MAAMSDTVARSFLPAEALFIRHLMMLRALIIFAIFFGVLANAAHVEAHTSGQHSHDAVEASHHVDDEDDVRGAVGHDTDDGRPAKVDHKADHAAGHNHVVGDRSSGLQIVSRAHALGDAAYRLRPDLALPSALSAPLLEPPSA